MENKDTLQDDLEVFAPKLTGIPRQEPPLQLPPDYFARLTENVIAEAKTPAIEPVKSPTRWLKWTVGMTAIAAVFVGALVWRTANTVVDTPPNCAQLACVSESEIWAYLEAHPDALDEATLEELMDISSLPVISLDDEAIEHYLEENEDKFLNSSLDDIL